MLELSSNVKSLKIKESLKLTKEKRKSQICLVRELKINTAHLGKKQLEQLRMLFIEAKWLRNAILGSDDIHTFNIGKKLSSVKGLDKVRLA